MTGPVGRALAGVETEPAAKGRGGVAGRASDDDGAFGRTVASLAGERRRPEEAAEGPSKPAGSDDTELRGADDMEIVKNLTGDGAPAAPARRGGEESASLLSLFRDAMQPSIGRQPGEARNDSAGDGREAADSGAAAKGTAGESAGLKGEPTDSGAKGTDDTEQAIAEYLKGAIPAAGVSAAVQAPVTVRAGTNMPAGAERGSATTDTIDRWLAARNPNAVADAAADHGARSPQGSAEAAADDLFRFARGKGDMPPAIADVVARSVGASVAATAEGSRPQGAPTGEVRMASPVEVDQLADSGERMERAETLARHVPDIAVIENRKFLGVAAGQTSTAAVVSAVTENSEWNAMLREASATAAKTLDGARNASNTLKIQLSPIELGMVTATFRMSGGHLSIELRVETIEAYRQLSDDQNGLVKALKGQGVDVEHVVIQHTSGDRSMQTVSGSAPSGGNAGIGANGDPSGGQQSAAGQQRGEAGGEGYRRPAREQGEGDARRIERHPAGDVYL